MLIRTVTLAAALFCGFLCAQAPEFAQQYRQRLGGTVDELGRVVAEFDRDAGQAGLDRQKAVAFMKGAQETLIRLRGASMEAAIARYQRLRTQLEAFERSGPLGRVQAMIASPDRPIVAATFADYEPAVPTTPAGLIAAVAGFFLVYLAFLFAQLLRLPFSLLHRAQQREAEEPF